MINSGDILLKQGQELREKGQTLEALDMINCSLDAFASEGNQARFAHALLDRAICWQHLYQFHDYDLGFAILYKKDAEALLELVKAQNISVEEPGAHFMNAKACTIFGQFEKAVEFYQLALQKMTPGREAQKGDWQTNLGKALYLSGKQEDGIKEILAGIEQIKNHIDQVDDYTGKVWLSGGYLRLSEVLAEKNPEESKKYLELAKALVTDLKFSVRQKQIEVFIKTGKTGL